MLKIIKKMDVEAEALIEIVENETGQVFVLKTSDPYEVTIERKFIEVLDQNNIFHLVMFQDEDLLPNQLLLEYIENSPTIGKSETPLWFEKWGAAIRNIHNIRHNESTRIQEDGSLCKIVWSNFIKERYQMAVNKNNTNKLLDVYIAEKIGEVLNKFTNIDTEGYSLIHGDLHSNNALIKNDEVVLFDKGNPILYGDRFYDLAIFIINFGFSEKESDRDLVRSFMKGYGEDFLEVNKERVELNTLLRAFERHGNKHEPQTGLIISHLLEKYQNWGI